MSDNIPYRTLDGQARNQQAADAAILERLPATIEGDGVRARRHRAVLVIGMAAAFRRSELVALVPEGLCLTIRGSKTDQTTRGATIFKMREVGRRKMVQILADHVRNAELSKNHAAPASSDPIG